MKNQKYTVIETAALQLNDNLKALELLGRFGDEKVRLMSFALTVPQMKAKLKTVTRRHSARNIEVGDLFLAVEKARGVRREDRKSIAVIRAVSVRRETLGDVTEKECALEGFPELSPAQFIEMYLKGNSISRRLPLEQIECTRIEFKFEMMF